MGDFDPLAEAAEKDGMLPDDVSGAYCLDADLFLSPLSYDPFSGIDSDFIEVSVDRAGYDLGHLKGGAAGCILLKPVMGLDDLDVIVIAQDPRHVLKHLQQKVDAQAHIRSHHAWNLLRERRDLL